MHKRKSSKKTPELVAQMLEMRIAGKTQREIAFTCNVSVSLVCNWLHGAYDAVILPKAEECLKLELDRLDKYLKVLDKAIEKGDVSSIGQAIKISHRRAQLLGLDKEKTPELTTEQPQMKVIILPAGCTEMEMFGINGSENPQINSTSQNKSLAVSG